VIVLMRILCVVELVVCCFMTEFSVALVGGGNGTRTWILFLGIFCGR